MLEQSEARRLTERIRTALDRVSSAWADLGERITEAYERRADLALGYGSWAEYAEAELKPSGQIAAEVRRELVSMLSAKGMSTRAIAPTVGVTRQQVSRDQVAHDVPPAPDPERINPVTGEVVESHSPVGVTGRPTDGATEAVERATVTGLDGKTHTRTPPKNDRRPPGRGGASDAHPPDCRWAAADDPGGTKNPRHTHRAV